MANNDEVPAQSFESDDSSLTRDMGLGSDQ